MNSSPKPQFLLLLRHHGTPPTAAELEQIMDKFTAWKNGIKARGECVATQGLEFAGRVVRLRGAVSDGPFAEAKEVVGGYMIIEVGDLDRATEIAQACPGLEQPGTTIEVRPINRSCE